MGRISPNSYQGYLTGYDQINKLAPSGIACSKMSDSFLQPERLRAVRVYDPLLDLMDPILQTRLIQPARP
ncbi:hypothetical protein GCM10008174_34850 [Methylopila turkensis]|uniref:Uncharacterized protein n=1 Tax=Methylopila turkensis TaxID=1437816 RepID=A0A9W6N7Y2_9HYPH|nr:hypothetical protein GCM10008174_34850 [Methylopila turkensis]